MPDTKKETHPIHDLMGMIADRSGDNASWPVTIFLVAGLIIVLSIMGIQLAMAKRKAAKLASKLRLEEEERETAREEQKRAKDDAAREAARKKASEADKRIRSTSLELLDLKAVHQEQVEALSSVTSWDDIIVVDKRS